MDNQETLRQIIAGVKDNRWVITDTLKSILVAHHFTALTDPIQIGESHFQFRVWGDGGIKRMIEVIDPIKHISAMGQVLNLEMFVAEFAGQAYTDRSLIELIDFMFESMNLIWGHNQLKGAHLGKGQFEFQKDYWVVHEALKRMRVIAAEAAERQEGKSGTTV